MLRRAQQPPEPEQRARWGRYRPLRRRLIIAAVLLGLGAAAVGAARLVASDTRLTRWATQILNQNLAGHFTVQRVHWVLPFGLEVQGFVATDPGGRPALRVAHAEATLEPLELLRHRVHIVAGRAAGVQWRWLPASGSNANPPEAMALVRAFAPRTASARPAPHTTARASPWRVVLRRVSITGIDAAWASGNSTAASVRGASILHADLTTSAAGIQIDGDVRVPQGQMTSRRLGWSAQPVRLDATGVHVATHHAGKAPTVTGLRAAKLHLSVAGADISAAGSLRGLGGAAPWGAKLHAEAQLDLRHPALHAFLPPALWAELRPQGRVQLRVDLDRAQGAPWHLRAEATGEQLTVASVHPTLLTIRGRWEAGVVHSEHTELRLADGAVLDITGTVHLGAGPWQHDLTLTARQVPVEQIASGLARGRWVTALPRRVSGELHLAGADLRHATTRLDATLQLQGLLADTLHGALAAVALRTTADVDTTAVRFTSLTLDAAGTELRLTGRVPFAATAPMQVQLQASSTQPNAVLAALQVTGSAASMSLQATVAGPRNAPRATGTLHIGALALRGLPAADVQLPARYSNHLAQIGRDGMPPAEIAMAQGRIELTGRIELPPAPGATVLQLHLRGEGLQLAAFSRGHASGVVALQGDVQGPLDGLQGTGEVHGKDLALRSRAFHVQFHDARAEISLSAGDLMLHRSVLEPSTGGRIAVRGELALPSQSLAAHVDGSAVDLGLVAPLLPARLQLAGQADVRADLGGTLRAPTYTATVEARDLSLAGVGLGALQGQVKGDTAALHAQMSSRGDAGRLQLDGDYSWGQNHIAATASATQLALGSLVTALHQLTGHGLALQGQADLQLRATGSLPHPHLDGTAQLTDLVVAEQALHGPASRVTLHTTDSGTYTVHLSLLDSLQADASIAVEPNLTAHVNARLQQLDLGVWLAPLRQRSIALETSGAMAISYAAAGSVLTGSAQLSALRLQAAGETLQTNAPIQLRWAGGVLQLGHIVLAGPHGEFTLAGQVGRTMDLSATGRINAVLLSALTPAITHASGDVVLTLQVQGPMRSPRVDGDVQLATPIELRPRSMLQTISLQQGRLQLHHDTLTVTGLQGHVGAGSFRVDGAVRLVGMRPVHYDLHVTARQLGAHTRDVVAEGNADLHLVGPGPLPKITGTVDITRGRYLKKFQLQDFNFIAARPSTEAPLAERWPWLARLRLDLHAVSTSSVGVKVDAGALVMQVGLDADLGITGSAANPVLDGHIAASSGSIDFPRAKLNITQGAVDFTPSPASRSKAAISLQAEGEVTPSTTTASGVPPSYYVTLTLRGDLQRMALDLTSDPTLSRLEILSLLVAGQTQPAGGGSTTSRLDAALAFAGSQIAAPVSSFLEKELERTLNLSLHLGTEVTSEAVRVTASQSVTRRFTIEGAYERSLVESQTITSLRAKLQLSDRLFLEGQTQAVSGDGTASSTSNARLGSLELKLRLIGD